jgi:uncharacterized protein YndB with AHSA1/START domain
MTPNDTYLAVFLGSKNSPRRKAWDELPEAERKAKEREGIAAWHAWVAEHRDQIVGMGGPLGRTKKVAKQGIEDVRNELGGFTVVRAESHEAAAKLFENHPHFTIFPGDRVEVMPVLAVPAAVTKITVETNVQGPIGAVWKAYTTPEDIIRWNAASDDWHTTAAMVDLREGGKFSSRMEAKDGSTGFDFAGTYTKVVPNKLIEYAFGDRTAQVEFTPGSNGVGVRVTFDSESTHSIEQQRSGWQAILDNFARHVKTKKAA